MGGGGIVFGDGPIVIRRVCLDVFVFLWSIWAKTLEINFIIQTMTKPSAKKGIIWRSIWLDFIYLFFICILRIFRFQFDSIQSKIVWEFCWFFVSDDAEKKMKSCKIVCYFDEISTLKCHKSMVNLLLFTIFSVFPKQHTILLILCLIFFFLDDSVPRATESLPVKCKQKTTNRTEILQRAIRNDFIK